ncbi:MAG: DUF2299 domain-containing protein [Promethearchaeota archaeon]|nr:MAG: DUF2299 domain-containing protein [Candidatus Lokiarchaeota archaeon]
MSETEIERIIREYLLEEGLLRKRIQDAKLEFGFQFAFPPGQGGHIMAVYKPKEKNILIISSGTQISDQHISALNLLNNDKKLHYFMDLRKFFLLKDVFFRIDVNNYRYEISDQKFLDQIENFSKNCFFKSIRKVFNCAAYSNIILAQYCSGKIKAEEEEFYKSKDFTGSDFSLYS